MVAESPAKNIGDTELTEEKDPEGPPPQPDAEQALLQPPAPGSQPKEPPEVEIRQVHVPGPIPAPPGRAKQPHFQPVLLENQPPDDFVGEEREKRPKDAAGMEIPNMQESERSDSGDDESIGYAVQPPMADVEILEVDEGEDSSYGSDDGLVNDAEHQLLPEYQVDLRNII